VGLVHNKIKYSYNKDQIKHKERDRVIQLYKER
jgi:hypothetical protein